MILTGKRGTLIGVAAVSAAATVATVVIVAVLASVDAEFSGSTVPDNNEVAHEQIRSDIMTQEEDLQVWHVQTSEVIPDIIMPTKVSRPGCEVEQTCYLPAVFTVRSGDSVTWINEDSAFHSVTSGPYDEPTSLFDSKYMDPYQKYTLVFEAAGQYDYHCTLHPWMTGTILVVDER